MERVPGAWQPLVVERVVVVVQELAQPVLVPAWWQRVEAS